MAQNIPHNNMPGFAPLGKPAEEILKSEALETSAKEAYNAYEIALKDESIFEKRRQILPILSNLLDLQKNLDIKSLPFQEWIAINANIRYVSEILAQIDAQVFDQRSLSMIEQEGASGFARQVAPNINPETAQIFEQSLTPSDSATELQDKLERTKNNIRSFNKFSLNAKAVIQNMGLEQELPAGSYEYLESIGNAAANLYMASLVRKSIRSEISDQDLEILKQLTKPTEYEKDVLAEYREYESFPLLREDEYEKIESGKISGQETRHLIKSLQRVMNGLNIRREALISYERELKLQQAASRSGAQ